MKQKYLALALSAVFATALAGCGSDNDSNYQPQLPDTETPDNGGETPDNGGETPDNGGETPDNGGETPDNGGETPDNGGETPDNGGETPDNGEGPVVGDEEDNVGDAATDPQADTPTVGGQQYVRGDNAKFDRELNPDTPNSGNATVLNSKTLQNKNLDNIVVGRETAERLGVKESLLRYVGKSVDGFSDKPETDTTSLQVTNVANGINVTSDDFELNGLVSIEKGQGNQFTVTGQENAVTGIGPITAAGSTLSTRIFGNKSLDLTNDAEKNSARFLGKENAQGNLDIASFEDAKFETTKLNHVQYGRVTSVIDKLDEDALSKDGTKYYESELVAKDPTNKNNSVDTYFYRGTGETTVAQMDALQAKGGTVEYAGHALMYGIDNSYHGDVGNPDSNSFGGTEKPLEGKGNFVQATVNMGDRTVQGNIYNVWEVQPTEGEAVFRKDNLVDFSGQIFGNTAKGESNLSYDKDKKGAFKGSFYGDQAQEFGGSVNSVDKGYGSAAWGGVFGANKVEAPVVTPPVVTPPEDGNANQTE